MQLKIHSGGYNSTGKLLTTLKVGACKKITSQYKKISTSVYSFV